MIQVGDQFVAQIVFQQILAQRPDVAVMNAAHPVAQVRDDIQADLVHRFADILGIGFRVRGRDQNFLFDEAAG